jgi:two-component system response regulator DesR
MDVALPGTDGITATRLITTAFPSARVVIVTDYGSARLREAARLAGATDYVLKENLGELGSILSRGNA